MPAIKSIYQYLLIKTHYNVSEQVNIKDYKLQTSSNTSKTQITKHNERASNRPGILPILFSGYNISPFSIICHRFSFGKTRGGFYQNVVTATILIPSYSPQPTSFTIIIIQKYGHRQRRWI